jgi:hypothetical protein
MSDGIYTPARWPICIGPFAYGSAEVIKYRLKSFMDEGKMVKKRTKIIKFCLAVLHQLTTGHSCGNVKKLIFA